MSEAPAELWMRERQRLPGRWYQTHYADEPDAVRYVRADLYEALRARLDGLMEQMTVVRSWNEAPCLEPLGTDYPR
jgi:hypothetical protein